ncbi:MAG: YMGG-like glycine zipper-containing protein [Verrucomicrobia bacterium]|nr:YMGG-like glycine zipper-containing protein [Verrucomicrobiota bacterium]
MNEMKLAAAMMATCVVLAGCTSTEQGAGYGTLGGAAIGGAVGGWQGAAIGAGAGALTGALVGNAVEQGEERNARAQQPPPPPPPPPGAAIPLGLRTNRPGLVKSPWNPNGPLVDVTGFAPGSVVKDPTTGKNFLVP